MPKRCGVNKSQKLIQLLARVFKTNFLNFNHESTALPIVVKHTTTIASVIMPELMHCITNNEERAFSGWARAIDYQGTAN
ncbi:hypothetical protein FGO68_gene7687 [Halteria grandinella]|uniref:Uncharacterized protein n=1 Tax=Halteria grandinella TaxID=5974 RepID=A0A8J8P079_HALGN|nr:hypothetical protein FGO68_gene7687 [Halteria grandinella]